MRHIATKHLPAAALALAMATTAHAASGSAPASNTAAPKADSALQIEDNALYDPAKYPVVPDAKPTTPVGTVATPTTTAQAIPAAVLPMKPVEPPKPVAAPVQTWSTDGDWLRPAIDAWAKKAGWSVYWLDVTGKPLSPDVDRRLPSTGLKFEGTFDAAVRQCIELYVAHGDHWANDTWTTNRVITIQETN